MRLVEKARVVTAQDAADGVIALAVGDVVTITSRANEETGWFYGASACVFIIIIIIYMFMRPYD